MNFTINVTVIFSKPKTLFVHNTTLNIMLTHFLINPKISSTTTLSFKLVSYNNIRNVTSNFLRITVELKLTLHLTRTHYIRTITLRVTFTNCRSSHRPILTRLKIFRINISIRIRISQLKTIKITTMRTFTKVFHNTNLSNAIRSNKTILFNKPVGLKLNIKHSTTLTRSCISSVKIKYKVIKLHTSHSLPSPLNCSNINYTSITLTFS